MSQSASQSTATIEGDTIQERGSKSTTGLSGSTIALVAAIAAAAIVLILLFKK